MLAQLLRLIAAVLALSTLLNTVSHADQALSWQTLAPGLDYVEVQQQVTNPWAHYHVFRLNLKRYRLELAFASDIKQRAATVRQLALKTKALLAINGGFFSPQLKPLGLRIHNGKIKQNLKKVSWWGVFYIHNQRFPTAHIASPQQFKHESAIEFAVQGGPRLVVARQIPKLKAGIAERSAIGIDNNGNVILVVTQHAPVSTYQLASFMAKKPEKGGLGCIDALNLDGGSSTQLYAKLGEFELSVPGFTAVSDVVLVRGLG